MVYEDSGDLFDIKFNDDLFSYPNESEIIRDYGGTTTFLRGAGILLLRAGLILIQFGCVPSTNVNKIIFQNFIDLSCATIAFGTIGYMFAFGNDVRSAIGWGGWIFDDAADLDKAVLGWSCIITATGIYITMVIGRMFWVGNLLVSTVLAAIIMPIVMHWMWTSSGWMYKAKFLNNIVTYKDYGGGMIIHVCGGTVAIIGGLFLGRRLLRLQDIGEASISPGSPAYVTVGYLLVIIGLMGVCLPTANYELNHLPYNFIGITFVNNILAAAGGIITVVLLQICTCRRLSQYWSLLQHMQGAIAGIVMIASGVDVYTPIVALGLGILGALLYYWIAYLMFDSSVEDYVNITAIHLSCGFLGTLMPPLCGVRERFGVIHTKIIHFTWQLICDLAVLAFVATLALIVFFIVWISNLLRNNEEEENHNRAMIVLAQNPNTSFCSRIFGLGQLLQPAYRFKSKDQTPDVYTSAQENKNYKGQENTEVQPTPSSKIKSDPTEDSTTKSKSQNTMQIMYFTEKKDANKMKYPQMTASSKSLSDFIQHNSKMDFLSTTHNTKDNDEKAHRSVTHLLSLKINTSRQNSNPKMDLQSTINDEFPDVTVEETYETVKTASPRIGTVDTEEKITTKELENTLRKPKYPDKRNKSILAYPLPKVENFPMRHNSPKTEYRMTPRNVKFFDEKETSAVNYPPTKIQRMPIQHNSHKTEIHMSSRNTKFHDKGQTSAMAHSSVIQNEGRFTAT